jgi:hypothetical protein
MRVEPPGNLVNPGSAVLNSYPMKFRHKFPRAYPIPKEVVRPPAPSKSDKPGRCLGSCGRARVQPRTIEPTSVL